MSFILSWAETGTFGTMQTHRSPCPPLGVCVVIGVSVGVAVGVETEVMVAFPIA